MLPVSHFMSGRDNNFNLLRMLAALFIAYYHCYFMTIGPGMTDEMHPLMFAASQIVLNFFFVASGFLIARSFERRRDLSAYIAARALRLLPGVFVLSLLIAFMMGPVVTEVTLAEYFSSLLTWLYVPATTSLQPDMTLPGVFASNVNPYEIDEALWTLRYEVVCYIGLALVGVAGLLRRGRGFAALSVVMLCGYLLLTYATSLRDVTAINHMTHFGISFFLGMVFYIYRESIPLYGGVAFGLCLLAALAVYLTGWDAGEPLTILATGYAIFWLAYVPGGVIRRYNALGDYSYGVYIYHFPVEQLFMHYIGGFTIPGLFIVSLPVTLACAVLSWRYVEKPSLDGLPDAAAWVRRKFGGGETASEYE